ncbi:MAG: sigma-54-dependent transcriptional regulator [Bacteroidales bacterium]
MKKTTAHILIVDDNEEALIALRMLLSKHFTTVTAEKNPNLILSHLNGGMVDVVILDMNFSAGINTGNEGIYWLRKIRAADPGVMAVLLTAYGSVDLAVKALKEGGADFLQKPWENERLLATVNNVLKLRRSKMEVEGLRQKQQHLAEGIEKEFVLFAGKSPAMQRVWNTVDKIAPTDANVLILGENGTGKEMVAREIHRRSSRSMGVFVKVDMGAVSESLFESELFGHVKGAFTGAHEGKAGRLEIASGGTLFMDEIGNLPATLQSKILTVLQNREVVRLGSNKPVPIDIRLVSATNMPVMKMVEQKSFREDLLYRINTIQLEVPPLRERKSDFEGLLSFFLEKYKAKYNRPALKVKEGVVEKLKTWHWPGNVRELENLVEKAVILSEGDVLRPADFVFQHQENGVEDDSGDYNLEAQERKVIARALRDYSYNLSEAAAQLGITRATLYRKIKKYGL